MFAAHKGLGNIIAIVDVNGQQALGYTKDVIDLSPIEERWRAFGWDVHVVHRHDTNVIKAHIARTQEWHSAHVGSAHGVW